MKKAPKAITKQIIKKETVNCHPNKITNNFLEQRNTAKN